MIAWPAWIDGPSLRLIKASRYRSNAISPWKRSAIDHNVSPGLATTTTRAGAGWLRRRRQARRRSQPARRGPRRRTTASSPTRSPAATTRRRPYAGATGAGRRTSGGHVQPGGGQRGGHPSSSVGIDRADRWERHGSEGLAWRANTRTTNSCTTNSCTTNRCSLSSRRRPNVRSRGANEQVFDFAMRTPVRWTHGRHPRSPPANARSSTSSRARSAPAAIRRRSARSARRSASRHRRPCTPTSTRSPASATFGATRPSRVPSRSAGTPTPAS